MEGDRGRGRSTPRTRTRAQRASRSRDSDREAPEPTSERSGRGRPQQLEGAAVGGRNEDAEAAEGAEAPRIAAKSAFPNAPKTKTDTQKIKDIFQKSISK